MALLGYTPHRGGKFGAKLGEVVDFAVEGDPETFFIDCRVVDPASRAVNRHWLVAGRGKIDDGEASVAKGDGLPRGRTKKPGA